MPHRLRVYQEGRGFRLLATPSASQLTDVQVFSAFDFNRDGREELVWKGRLTSLFWRLGQATVAGRQIPLAL